MGCCSCKLQCGQLPEAEVSHVILKVIPNKIVDEKSTTQDKPDENMSPIKNDERSTLKPDYISLLIPSQYKTNSPENSKNDLLMTNRAFGDIIQEGELKKYRPGFNKQFITRWGVLTNDHFMYFKNQGSAKIWGQAPLFSVSLNEIKTVSKVNFNMPGLNMFSEQFEIFLKNEDPTVPISRETHKMPLMKSVIDSASTSSQKKCVVKGILMKRPLRYDSPEKDTIENVPVCAERMSWSVREVQWFTSEKRLLFISSSGLERDFWIMNILKACGSG
ncbi:hypothetical protein SteCoe_1122 [Stentor coeruleus]|uniref:PH domain-containing protein n=1 Tax=Stentor coeruleus TaxID=5963 RepID=A0A1R2D2Q1_9CILI|nr:hypothetical protein SteCoe_1122 [Stentor coeruleus]